MSTTNGFSSVLFERDARNAAGSPSADNALPDYFHDVNLDVVVAALLNGRADYQLNEFFTTPLHTAAAVGYRQSVFRDLEKQPVREVADRFVEGMQTRRRFLRAAESSRFRRQRQRWELEALRAYCDTVEQLDRDLTQAPLESAALQGLQEYVRQYMASAGFTALRDEAAAVYDELAHVRYDMVIHGGKITVGPFDDESDYSQTVLDTFARFQQRDAKDHSGRSRDTHDMDHVEAAVLELVSRLFPAVFEHLARFCTGRSQFGDEVIDRFDRELQFYLTYLDYLKPLREAGLPICYPEVTQTDKQILAEDSYDLALAHKLIGDDESVVCNEFHLTGPERILVISGPNQGGKTTLARTIGQLHHLASLGCPVPGRRVRTLLADRIFSHFEQEEDLGTLASKLEDDLNRIHAILAAATPASVIIMNEIFTSTTLEDALLLSREILGRIIDLDAVSVCVSFLDELSTLGEAIVSMVSTVDPDDPATRTFKVIRKAADGRAYAMALARKHRLTYEELKMRIAS